MQATTIGLDIAKQVFFVVGVDQQGHQVWRKRLRRGQVTESFAQQVPCRVGLDQHASLEAPRKTVPTTPDENLYPKPKHHQPA